MDELNSLRKKNGETLDCNEWNKLVSVINYIIEFYNQYPTKLSEFENDINLVSEENIASVIQELVNNGTLSSILGESGADGKSAYLLALENGFVGTVTEWLASLKGLKGSDGKSAFVLAIDNGYVGTLQQWLDSLKGQNGITPHIDLTTGNWFIGNIDTGVHAQGPAGLNGQDGTVADLLLVDWNQTDNTAKDYIKNKPGVGVANGLATLDSSGKVPSSQLPSYVDDVIEGYYHNSKFYEHYTESIEGGDDAAQAAWGEGWRMPTVTEFQALGDAVNAVWTSDYESSGVAGLVCIDKTDSTKVLFFPAAGFATNGNIGNVNSEGYYWSSSLANVNYGERSNEAVFNSSGAWWDEDTPRCLGRSIRAILASGDSTRPYVEINGVKWSTMNIGASTETDYGLYFQWGDTQGYTASQVGTDKEFTWESYKYCNDSAGRVMTKYNNTDGLTTLVIGSTESYTDEITAETSKIYLDLPTNYSYRWSGTAYVLIGSSQTLSDWNLTDSTAKDFIKNKPTIPTKLGLLIGNSSEHDYVEIEGIKWATMNLGANSVTDPGLYFQWGDTQGYTADQVGSGEGKKYFESSSYIYKTYESNKFSKYNNTDNKYVLDPSDDAVSVAWGNSWRMPTKKECEILKKATTAEWTNDYQNSGTPGLLLTYKKDNSKVLFFPAAGDAFLSSVYDADTRCFYWLSTRDSNTYSNVDIFSANSEGYTNALFSRYCGLLVRGVYGGSIFYNEINNKPYIPNTLELNMKYMQFNFHNGTNNKGYFRTEKGFVWATRNIGATLDNDTGLYFSSRDLDGYSSNDIGSSSGQKQFTELEFLLKFNSQYSGVYGTQANDDGENPTVPRDRDAARQIYGGKWRLPTVLDILNLYEESKKIVMESEGIRFYLPTFDYVNTSLFIPKSGYYENGTHYGSTYPVIRISRGSNYSVDSIGSGSDGYVILNETKPQFYLGDCYVSNFTNLDIPYQVFAGVPIRPILSYTSTAAKVAETGDYNDLINKPVISGGGTVVQSNWNETDTSSPAYILNKPTILNGTNGKSAYELYVNSTSDNPVKTLQEWLASLQGTNGTNGKSAYLSYLDNTSDNPVLSEADWIASLHGSNGQDGQNGLDGLNGITPHIDPVTKHWMIGNTDTNVVAEGKDGTASTAGADGKSAYQSYVDTTSDDPVLTELQWVASLHGADGTNGLNGTNGQDGVTPTINPTTKHWMLGSTDTGVVAEGQNGSNGTNGTDGVTPHIDSTTGNWFIGSTDTGVHAQGPSGTSLSNETATQGGSTLSAVTTGEKYTWNLKANIWSGTQAQYDAIITPDANTIYIITAAS